MLLFCLNTVSAAPGDTIYVNGSSGNDSWDGQSVVWNGTSGPKLSIKNATGTVNSNGTVYVADGGYTGYNNIDITIIMNMAIIGETQNGVIINAQHIDRIFTIDPGITVTMENLRLINGETYIGGIIGNRGTLNLINCTLIGGVADIGGAIVNEGVLNVTGCTFTDNNAEEFDDGDFYQGGAIANYEILIINNSTFTGNFADYGGAIFNSATSDYHPHILNITNCTFTDNYINVSPGGIQLYGLPNGAGGAICTLCWSYGAVVNITNCTFTGNSGARGGAIFNICRTGTLNVTIINCTFTGNWVLYDIYFNTGGGFGGAICNAAFDDGIATLNVIGSTFTGRPDFSAFIGGAIFNTGFNTGNGPGIAILNVFNCTFIGNKVIYQSFIDKGGFGGVIANDAELDGASAYAYITDNTFIGNYATYGGGVIYNNNYSSGNVIANAIVHMNFNRFFGNTLDDTYGLYGSVICNSINGTVDADNNWWGTNTPNFSQLLYGMPDPDSWLVMNAVANPLSIRVGETSTVTVTILSYNKNSGIYSPVVHCAPIPAIFTATLGDMDPESIFIIPNLGIDQVQSIFTSTHSGTATINATTDNETVLFLIQVNIIPTYLTVADVSDYYGNNATLTAILKNDLGQPVVSETVHFAVDFNYIANSTTDSTGTATLKYPLNFSVGSHTIFAVFHGTNKYKSCVGTGTLTVNINPTTVSVGDVMDYHSKTVSLNATLTDNQQKPISGELVYFTVNGQSIGSSITDTTGTATINNYLLNLSPGAYVINATFNGNSNYTYSSGLGTLTVNAIPTNVSVPNMENFAGQTITLTANINDYYHNPVNTGTIKFTVNNTTLDPVPVNNGIATLNWIIPLNWNTGIYTITALFNGTNTNYADSTNTGNLTIDPTPTNLTVSNVHNFAGQTITLTANINDYYHNPVNTGTIKFTVNNTTLDPVPVNNGIATLNWIIPLNWNTGIYTITALFNGTNTNYADSTNTGNLTIDPTPTNLTVSNVHNFAGQNVTLIINVSDCYGNQVDEGSLRFTINGTNIDTVPVNNGTTTLNWQIPLDWSTGTYSNVIFAEYLGTSNFTASNSYGNLTVDKTPTNITVGNVTGINTQIVTLNATLTDVYSNPLSDKTINFKINGNIIDNATTNINGVARLNYNLNSAGNFIVTAEFAGDNGYLDSTGDGNLTVEPTSNLYILITGDKENPSVGETFTLTYKLGNNGPDDAENVTIIIPIPEGFQILSITGDGNWTYDAATRTITWTFNNVTVGDPYLYVTGWTTHAGSYLFGASILSDTYNINSQGVTSFSLNAVPQVNAASSNTVGMQNTGTPITGIVLAILMVLGGFISTRKKQ